MRSKTTQASAVGLTPFVESPSSRVSRASGRRGGRSRPPRGHPEGVQPL